MSKERNTYKWAILGDENTWRLFVSYSASRERKEGLHNAPYSTDFANNTRRYFTTCVEIVLNYLRVLPVKPSVEQGIYCATVFLAVDFSN